MQSRMRTWETVTVVGLVGSIAWLVVALLVQ